MTTTSNQPSDPVRALWEELYVYLTANDDLNVWRRESYENDALEIIAKHFAPTPSLATAIEKVKAWWCCDADYPNHHPTCSRRTVNKENE